MTRIRIQHVTRIRILHVKRIDLVHRRTESEGRLRDRSGHQSVPTKDAYELKETKDTQGINYGGFSNDNMTSDFSTPQSHAINNGSSVISNSVIDGVLESALEGYNILQLIVYKSLCFFINKAWLLFEDIVNTPWS